jgi:RNA polymerase sigma factor (sigma-70 family)
LESNYKISNDKILNYIERINEDPYDITAWENIYYCADKCIYYVIKNKIFNTSVHDDVAQDIRTRIFKNIKKYDGSKAKFTTWVTAVSINYCKSWLKSNYTKISGNEEDISSVDLGELVDIIKDPDDLSERVVSREVICDAIKKVKESVKNPKQCLAYLLVRIEGYSIEDCSRILDEPVSAVHNWIYRVGEKLNKLLKEGLYD